MSNPNANKSNNNTNPAAAAPPAAAPKPVVTPGDVKVSTGNATDAAASKPESNSTNATAAIDAGAAGSDAGESDSNPLMFCIVTGPVKQFKTAAKAEEFLNGPDAPNDYVVIRGRTASTKRKITLRD